MSTLLPHDTMEALRVPPYFEPTRCDSRSLLLLRMLSSADTQAGSAGARKTSMERAIKPAAHAAAGHQIRWLDALASSSRLRRFSLWTDQRLALGLADGVLENGGLDLHRFWGTPVISGSKLKGIAADAACEWVRKERLCKDDKAAIFGAMDSVAGKVVANAGCVSFLSAHPASPSCRLELDVLTVHFPGYYAGARPDTDDDDPIPSPFPVVAEDQEFVFHLLCRDPKLREAEAKRFLHAAETCLRHALIHHGVGGKTRAGYGRFRELPERDLPTKPADDLFGTSPLAAHATSPQVDPPPPPSGTALETFVNQWSGGQLVPEAVKAFAAAISKLPVEQRMAAFDACVPPARRTSDDRIWQAFKSRHYGIRLLAELELS